MTFPFVSRERYDEMCARLEREIAELKADRRTHENYVATLFTGRKIHEEPQAARPALVEQDPSVPAKTEEQERQDEIRQAMKATGSRNFSVLKKWITKNRERAYEEKMRAGQTKAMQAADAAIQAGQQAAETNKAS